MQDTDHTHTDLLPGTSPATKAAPTFRPVRSETKNLTTLDLRFDLPLRARQISQWRGAFAGSADPEQDLFHNHQNGEAIENASEQPKQNGKNYLYRYPLIHYRVQRQKAAVWAMGKGAAQVADWLRNAPENVRIGHHTFPLQITDILTRRHKLEMTDEPHTYCLHDYLPLNQENFNRWQAAPGLVERLDILERTLVGHVFGFANAIRWQLPHRLELSIQHLSKMRPVTIYGHQRLAFNLVFRANIQLPPDIALGRSVAFGFGVLRPARKRIIP